MRTRRRIGKVREYDGEDIKKVCSKDVKINVNVKQKK